MPSVDINYWAVLVAAVLNMVIGAIWYSPGVFGKPWSKLIGKKMEDMRDNAGPGYAVSSVGALVQSYLLAHFVAYAHSTTFVQGAITGFWLWIGFIAISQAVGTVFAGGSWKLWQINTGYFLVFLVLAGGLLATWH